MTAEAHTPTIAILGASGLIGHGLALALAAEGFRVVPVARRFTRAQADLHAERAVTAPFVDLAPEALGRLIAETGADVVVNCVGVLQDAPGRSTSEAHDGFVNRLLGALGPGQLLVHLSIPEQGTDETAFSRSKREAERLIIASGRPYLVLRPGFVLTGAAYGGSALLRALAMWPFALPRIVGDAPLAATDLTDIAASIARSATAWQDTKLAPNAVWDVLTDETPTVTDVLAGLRRHLGGPPVAVTLPMWMLTVGARLGDAVALLGWLPPVRSTALRELRRGVAGDPAPWRAATGIAPRSLGDILGRYPAGVQERWFGRLYLLKAVIVVSLAVFWVVSGLIALFPAFGAARDILVTRGASMPLADTVTVLSSLLDIGIGVAIAVRRTHTAGLLAGVVVSLGYMAGAAVLIPELWLEPLGALVKTGPAIVLMVVALAICEDR